MDQQEMQRKAVIATVTRDLPQGFWADMGAGTRQAYLGAFHQVKNDPNILDDQRLDQLYQVRQAHMEKILMDVAVKHGLASSTTLLVENGRRYVYAAKGAVGLTQAYVQTIGDMPKPARFRERHAAQNRVVSEPRFDFGEEPSVLLHAKRFYGLIAHNPVGKRFSERDQALGLIQLCIPNPSCSSWIVQTALQELIAAYAPVVASEAKERGPTWKTDREEKKA